MKYLYSFLNNLMVAISFIIATCATTPNNLVLGIFLYVIAYATLDLHSYIDKKLNYPNNLFIKS